MVAKTAKKQKTKQPEVAPEAPAPRRTVLDADVRATIRWVAEARPDKDIGPAMTHYLVRGGEIRATNGKLTASYPWSDPGAAFLVSGAEFERVIARMGDSDEITVTQALDGTHVVVESRAFEATIDTLPVDAWAYPGVEDAIWNEIPDNFLEVLKSLRAFISDKPSQAWAGCVALDHGNCYATNNIAVAGAACDVGDVQALLPSYAVDFVLRRTEGLEQWACSDNYVAFRWRGGEWVRSQLVIGRFPERAAELVREAYALEPTQEITEEFREAFGHVAGLAEDTIRIFSDHMESKFKKSVVVAACRCEVPPATEQWDNNEQRNVPTGGGVSVWGAAFVAPVISQATRWQPSTWPKPVPFRGESVAGFVIGRKNE